MQLSKLWHIVHTKSPIFLKNLSSLVKKQEVVIFLIVFLLFNINFRQISGGDTFSSRYLPISIIKEFDLDLDEFPFLYNHFEDHWSVAKFKGRYMSTYPVMPSILSVPFYFLPVVFKLVNTESYSASIATVNLLSKLSAAFMTALSVVIIYFALKRLTKKQNAFYISLIYGIATCTWAISSQGLQQHGPGQLFSALTIVFLLKAKTDQKYAAYAAFPASISVLCRPPLIIFATLVLCFVSINYRKQALKFVAFASIFGTLLLSYNFYYFDSIFGGDAYRSVQRTEALQNSKTSTEAYREPFVRKLSGLFLCPNKGLFIYSPILIFAFVGIWIAFRKRLEPVVIYLAISVLATVLFYAKTNWIGGKTFGPRYLTDILPMLVIFFTYSWDSVFRSTATTIIFYILLIFSISVQVVGAFFYPSDWYKYPKHPGPYTHERLWSWTDTQIVRCLQKGPHMPSHLRALLREKAEGSNHREVNADSDRVKQ